MIATNPTMGCMFHHSGGWPGMVFTMMITRFAWYEHMWERIYGPVGYVQLVVAPSMRDVDGFK